MQRYKNLGRQGTDGFVLLVVEEQDAELVEIAGGVEIDVLQVEVDFLAAFLKKVAQLFVLSEEIAKGKYLEGFVDGADGLLRISAFVGFVDDECLDVGNLLVGKMKEGFLMGTAVIAC